MPIAMRELALLDKENMFVWGWGSMAVLCHRSGLGSARCDVAWVANGFGHCSNCLRVCGGKLRSRTTTVGVRSGAFAHPAAVACAMEVCGLGGNQRYHSACPGYRSLG